MVSKTHYVRCHAISRASVGRWEEMQQPAISKLSIFFEDRNAMAHIFDRIEDKGIKLHNGLDVIVIFKDYHGENVIIEAKGLIGQLLDAISFVTMAYCDITSINSLLTFNDDGTSTGELSILFDTDTDPYVPRIIDKEVLKGILESYSKFNEIDRNRTSRAMAWSRTSLIQKNTIFEFMSLWIALETINPILSDKLQQVKAKKKKWGNKWRGLISVFDNKLSTVSFSDVYKARVHLFHSLGEISQDYRAKLEGFIEPMRKAFVYGAGSIFELNEPIIAEIANKKPFKVFTIYSHVLKGKFANLPNDFDILLNRYPEFRIRQSEKKYYLDEKGRPNVDISSSVTARLPDKTKFLVESTLMEGAKDAGAKPTDFKIKDYNTSGEKSGN